MRATILIMGFAFLLLQVNLFAQTSKYPRLTEKATVFTDAGTIRAFFVSADDSVIRLSQSRRYDYMKATQVQVGSINKMYIKHRDFNLLAGVAGFVLGFTITAGLTKNGGDIDHDGKTSFFELFLTAIEGTTSKDRRRRNTAFIVGGVGGTVTLVGMILSNKKFTLTFPLNNRQGFYTGKRIEINGFANTRF